MSDFAEFASAGNHAAYSIPWSASLLRYTTVTGVPCPSALAAIRIVRRLACRQDAEFAHFMHPFHTNVRSAVTLSDYGHPFNLSGPHPPTRNNNRLLESQEDLMQLAGKHFR